MPYKVKSYLENHRGKKGREGNPYGFHAAIIVFLCVVIVNPKDKNNNNQ